MTSIELTQFITSTPTLRSTPRAASCGDVAYLIVGDSRIRESLSAVLDPGGISARYFASELEYLQCTKCDTAACIISDSEPGMTAALDMQRQNMGEGVPPTIFVSMHPDIYSGVRAFKAGAIDFLAHPVEPDELLCAVNEAFRRDRIARQRCREIAAIKARYSNLTVREREVLALVVGGLLNKQVAARLDISEITVKQHRGKMTHKMKARSFADLVCMAIKLQILDIDLAATGQGARESGIARG